jgi:hypothetical protein
MAKGNVWKREFLEEGISSKREGLGERREGMQCPYGLFG